MKRIRFQRYSIEKKTPKELLQGEYLCGDSLERRPINGLINGNRKDMIGKNFKKVFILSGKVFLRERNHLKDIILKRRLFIGLL